MSLEALNVGSDYDDGGLVGVMELQRNKKAAHKAAAKAATTNAMTKAAVGMKPGRTPEHYCHQKEMAARMRARGNQQAAVQKAQNGHVSHSVQCNYIVWQMQVLCVYNLAFSISPDPSQ
jgi:hypothetical protein